MFGRLGRLTAVAALIVAPAVVIAAGPAQADVPAPVWKALSGPITVRNAEIVGAAASRAALSGGLTAAESRIAVRWCKTLASCVISTGGVLALYGLSETSEYWWPWLKAQWPNPDLDAPVEWYDNAPGSYSWAQPLLSNVRGNNGDANIHIGSDSFWLDHVSRAEYPSWGAWYGIDMVRKSDGAWLHTNPGPFGGQSRPNLQSWQFPLPDPALYEIRRIHFDPTQAGFWQPDKGFYWGQELPPGPDDLIESVTTCRRPNGTTYEKSGTAAAGQAAVPFLPCDPGDTPIKTQINKVTPGGTRIPQSSTDLGEAKTQGDALYPLCASAGCLLQVKVDGDPCSVGEVGCMDWTKRLDRATCWYGPYELTDADCYVLERAYEPIPGGVPATGPNTDGDPDTHSDPAPYYPTPTPTPTPTTTTTTSPSPSPTVSPTVQPSGSPSPSPTPTPSSSSSPSPSPSTSTSTQPSPTPTGTSTAPPTDPIPPACAGSTYNLGRVQPEVAAFTENIGTRFGITTAYGYRDPAGDAFGEHSSGLAVDLMVYSDTAKGTSMARYLKANAAGLGIHWLIWQQHSWNAERDDPDELGRLMEDRGSDTANHMDHVHVYLYDVDGSNLSCDGGPVGEGNNSDCMSQGWSWNPVSWVLVPTKCALTWAFVPRQAEMQANFENVRGAWANSSPGKWSTALADIPAALDMSGGSCEGPTMNLGPPLNVSMQPANSCTGIRATLATVSRTALGAGLVLAAGFTCLRMLATGLSYGGFKGGE